VQESLARKLRILRADKGITLDEAERVTGVTRETIGALEHAQRGAHTRTLEKIAHGYDVPLEYLVSSEPALTLGKAEAPKTGQRSHEAEVWAHIPYGPGGRSEASKEALRILSEARDRGEISLNDVVFGFTDTGLDLRHISAAEKHPVYGPTVEFARRFAERWQHKIETGSFDRGSYQEFLDVIEDLQPILLRLGRQDKRENPQYGDSTFGPHIEWAISRIHDLFNPMIAAATEKFEEHDLARLRRERNRLETEDLRAGQALAGDA
jgi:transcriptional regulator with XRE-family HTH domain